MATFRTTPSILVVIDGLSREDAARMSKDIDTDGFAWAWDRDVELASVAAQTPIDEAEKIVEWLKAHGVERQK